MELRTVAKQKLPHQGHSSFPLIQCVGQILSIIVYVYYDIKTLRNIDREVLAHVANTYTKIHVYIGATFVITKNRNIPEVHQSIHLLMKSGMLIQCNATQQ